MNVLYVTNMYPVPDYTYFGIHVKEQIDGLKKVHGFEADVHFINGRERKTNYAKSILTLRAKIKSNKYDLIHVHYGISGLFLLFYNPQIPVIITLHSGELYQKKGFLNHILQKALTMAIVKKTDRIIVLNDDMASLLFRHKEKLIKLPCGSDTEIFKPLKNIQESQFIRIGFPGDKRRKEKNFSLFLSIVNILKSSYSIEVIEFHELTRLQVAEKLGKIDLLLMTSTVEGSPQIIKEAMLCNKPIVSTMVGDVRDLLQNVDNCFVIDSFEAQNFIKPIKSIINLPLKERISNGREMLFKAGLDSNAVTKKLYLIYKEVT